MNYILIALIVLFFITVAGLIFLAVNISDNVDSTPIENTNDKPPSTFYGGVQPPVKRGYKLNKKSDVSALGNNMLIVNDALKRDFETALQTMEKEQEKTVEVTPPPEPEGTEFIDVLDILSDNLIDGENTENTENDEESIDELIDEFEYELEDEILS